ncbi:MAG TPA: hypothetical protein VHH88_04275, partial [Verrucomicrobiae bacterium]|nr:hypothetical protein [Verrucomicrobiae bacterium]
NWNGNVSGGGTSRFLVGVSNAGLNPAQLAQIEFVNPAGFAPGRYAAAMLATGEIIPMANATLGAAVWTGKLVLTWPGGLVLQNSSNVFGPYLDIGSASAPFTWDITTAPQQFFRLRH